MDIEQRLAIEDLYFTPSEAAAYYGVPRSMQAIVIHHWNAPDARPSFANVTNMLINGSSRGDSANCIIGYDDQQARVRIIDSVIYPNVAFTSNGKINAQSVAIECDPLGETADPRAAEIYKAIGYRVYKWRQQFGWRVPLTRHRDYTQTACPGDYDLGRIDAEADKWAAGGYNPKPEPQPTPAAADGCVYRAIVPQLFKLNKNANLWDLRFAKYADAKAVKPYDAGTEVRIVGKATHPLGSIYLLTEYALGTADENVINAAGFKAARPQGFNKADMDAVAVSPAPANPPTTPITDVTPPATPIPTTPVEPQPSEYDKRQDAIIGVLQGTLNSLKALLIEIANSILSKLK
ncbi:MAG: N-acetylmuramoyl-L-alanine amidase [Methylotenera sp.]